MLLDTDVLLDVALDRQPYAGAAEEILDLTRFVAVAETDTSAVRYAAELPMRDFEDALQVAAARACGARHIVTRNVRDFDRSPIPALTPTEALSELLRG